MSLHSWFGRITQRSDEEPSPAATETLPIHSSLHAGLQRYIAEVSRDEGRRLGTIQPRRYGAATDLLARPGHELLELLHASMALRAGTTTGQVGSGFVGRAALDALLHEILRSRLPYTSHDLCLVIDQVVEQRSAGNVSWLPSLVTAVETYARRRGVSDSLSASLGGLCEQLRWVQPLGGDHNLRARLDGLLHQTSPLRRNSNSLRKIQPAPSPLTGHNTVTLMRKPKAERQSCQTPTRTIPSEDWVRNGYGLVAQYGSDQLEMLIKPAFAAVCKDNRHPIDPQMERVLKGYIWMCGMMESEEMADQLAMLAASAFHKLASGSIRSLRVGRTCIDTLALMRIPAALRALTELRTALAEPQVTKLLDQAVNKASQRQGTRPEEVAEAVAPTFGFDSNSTTTRKVGPYTAYLRVGQFCRIEIRWQKGQEVFDDMPADVRSEHVARFVELTKEIREFERALSVQRMRLERLMLTQREWHRPEFEQKYLFHPLIASLCSRLVWQISWDEVVVAGMWDGEFFRHYDGQALEVPEKAMFSLWHPVYSDEDYTKDWQQYLQRNRIMQPFAQAHRECYAPFEEELDEGLETHVSSRRLAGHALEQARLSTGANQRGWQLPALLPSDESATARLELPSWQLIAEWDIEGIPGPTDKVGRLACVSSDRVTFMPLYGDQPVPLGDVPPICYSEVMRDIEVLIGQSSTAHQVSWRDRLAALGFPDYWEAAPFRTSSEIARNRASLLAEILRQRPYESQCRLEGCVAVVRGKLRTYRVDLGCGLVRIGQKLVRLPDVPLLEVRWLPFENDPVLRTILTRVELLAHDSEIEDARIREELTGGYG